MGKTIDFASPDFDTFEKAGRAEAGKLGVVLVAGGLGERLGYSGIKVCKVSAFLFVILSQCSWSSPLKQQAAVHSSNCTARASLLYRSGTPPDQFLLLSFCHLNFRSTIHQALARKDDPKVTVPLAIMTSGDTDQLTKDLMAANDNFGLEADQVTFMKQEKVAALNDNDARIATKGAYKVATKPHGHGDVHMLMHSTGTAKNWAADGKKWVYFFQDTNGLAFNSLLAALGVSSTMNLSLNSVCVPRKAGDVVGGIMTLKKEGESPLTVNVEYSEIDALLKDAGKGGDINDPDTGFSPYPVLANRTKNEK